MMASAEEITGFSQQLVQGATIVQPPGPAQWALLHGMVTDRFGVTGVMDVASPYDGS